MAEESDKTATLTEDSVDDWKVTAVASLHVTRDDVQVLKFLRHHEVTTHYF